MTKIISLSDEAYQILKDSKRSGESFSDVVLRTLKQEKKKSLLEFSGKWVGDDADEVIAQIMKDREQPASRRVELFP